MTGMKIVKSNGGKVIADHSLVNFLRFLVVVSAEIAQASWTLVRGILGCVYTYPDIRISGYPDVKDPDFFGAFTRVGSKCFRRLHVSRYPDALYAAYSLCVAEIRKCFSLVKLHAFKLSFIFPFFLLMFVGWTTRSKFCLVSSVIDYKRQR